MMTRLHSLSIAKKLSVDVIARDYYSDYSLQIKKGESYLFSVDKNDKWIDFFIPCSADGYRNYLLTRKSKRVGESLCFTLCGTLAKNEDDHFAIGSTCSWTAPKDGELYFFANDHKWRFFYLNNFGRLKLNIERLG